MKRDGRKLDHKTLAEIRRMAVQRVWDGEKPSAVIASYGFSRQTIYKWLREARGRGRGLRALRSRKGTGRPRSLTAKQEQQLFRWINGKEPRQHGFDFGLWTRMIVSETDCGQVWCQSEHNGCWQIAGQIGAYSSKAVETRL